MINVTENLGTTSIKNILILFGIENVFQVEEAKKLVKNNNLH